MRLFASSVATLALVASLGCTAANAGTYSYTNYTVVSPGSVKLSDKDLHVDTSVGAGEIILDSVAGNPLSTFCFDIQHVLTSAGTFMTGTFLTGAIGSSINALLSNALSTDFNSAALQVAIWKTEYGDDLTVTSSDSSLDKKAATYLKKLSSGEWKADTTKAVAFLDGYDKDQSQIYLTAVPEPATFSILGLGLAGLVALRRRVTNKGAAAFT